MLGKVVEATMKLKEGGIGIREQVDFDKACDPEDRAMETLAGNMLRMQEEGLANIISNPGWIDLPPITGLADAYLCYNGSYMPCT